MTDDRVRHERDDSTGIARITIDNPERKNAYDPAMRLQMKAHLEEFAYDDDIKVVVLRGAGGVFSTGADMNNAYAWYGDKKPAEEPEDGGFHEELSADVFRLRAEGLSQADLADPFGDRDEHDVHHADPSDEQGDDGDAGEHQCHGVVDRGRRSED